MLRCRGLAEPASTQRHFHRVAEDLLAYGLLSGLTRVSGLVLLPILTRVLSVDEYGAVDVVAALVAFLALLLQVALPSALARHFGEDPSRQASLVSTLLLFLAGLGAVALLVVHAVADPLAALLLGGREAGDLVRLGAAVAWLASLLAVLDTVLRMERRIVAFNLLELVRTLAYVGLAVFLVVERGEGVRGVFEAQALAYALTLAISLVLVRRHMTTRVSREGLRTLLGFGAPLLPGQAVLWINQQTDRLLLLAFVGLSGVGIFGVSARIVTGVQFLLLVFRQAWQPHAMRLLDDPDRSEVYRRMLAYFGGSFAVLCLWLSALGPELFAVVVPSEFRGSYVVLPWLLGAAVLHHSANLTNLGLVATGATAGISAVSFAAVAANLALALLLIPSFGIAGAALGAFVAELLFTSLLLRMSARRTELRFDARGAAAVVAAYVLACAGMLAAWQALEGVASSAARVALALAASAWTARVSLRRSGSVGPPRG